MTLSQEASREIIVGGDFIVSVVAQFTNFFTGVEHGLMMREHAEENSFGREGLFIVLRFVGVSIDEIGRGCLSFDKVFQGFQGYVCGKAIASIEEQDVIACGLV